MTQPRIVERLTGARPVFSVEFFPPRDESGATQLWRTVHALERRGPAFVSVTYGAGGSTRHRTVDTVARLLAETSLTTMAHLTAVGQSAAELREVVAGYAATGVRNVLAVRGDPPGAPDAEWVAHPAGLHHADELVRLVRGVGDFCVGVAAFPNGHPRSPDAETDLRVLSGKLRAGAEFAVTQLFYDADCFLRLRDQLDAAGCTAPVLPGIMPLTTVATLHQAPRLSGAPLPPALLHVLEPHLDDAQGFRAAGLDATHQLCARLLREGVPGLHLYCLNRATAVSELVDRLGMASASRAAA
jgi:methylenetetrahydrofolate reductase (NADPH)